MNVNLIVLLILFTAGTLFIYFIIKRNWNNPKLAQIIFGCLIVVSVVIPITMITQGEQSGRRNFKLALKKLELEKTELTINSLPSELNVKEVVNELLKIDNLPNHHSGPTKRLEIMLSDGNTTVKFQLSRDSEYETQYWIGINYYTMGSIITSLFSELE